MTNAAESVNWTVNNSNKCKLGSITATGTFRTNGSGGTVSYYWIRKDTTGTFVQPQRSVVIAKGDTASHAVVNDVWVPQGNGTEQLFFVGPSYPLAPVAFTCRP